MHMRMLKRTQVLLSEDQGAAAFERLLSGPDLPIVGSDELDRAIFAAIQRA